jgi:hypothetical protein
MPVFPTEPTSAVAYFLTSPMYHNQLQQMRAAVLLDASNIRAGSSAQAAAASTASDAPRPSTHGPPSDVVLQTPRSAVVDMGGSSISASQSRPPSPPPSFTAEQSPLPSIAGTANPSYATTDNPLGPPLDYSYPISVDSTTAVSAHHQPSASVASSARLDEGLSGASRSSPEAHRRGHSADAAATESEVGCSLEAL